ncbi:MAG TPA: HD domain-containing phosphohydrolase [Planctomycetota bacterium]|nr:HD domain-containing phosphohydrolase [Planctomycetota bacterium]
MVAPAKILVVDDEEQIAQLLAGILRSDGHDAEYVTDGEAALARLRDGGFDLMMTDLRMPKMDGMRLIREAKDIAPDVDALVMTAYATTDTAVGALRTGVTDYLSKPFGLEQVRASIGKALRAREERRRRREEVSATREENLRLRADQRRAYVGIVATLIEAVEAKDRFNKGHSRRVAELAVRFARHLALPGRELDLLETSAKLHDIGKIGVPEEILNKPGKLTDEEFDVIKAHPVIGEQIIRPLDFLADARPIVRHHHERWDGGGYPDGLKGPQIPRPAAILSVCDAFDALTSDRPYRPGMPAEEALAILGKGAGTQWDPDLVQKFEAL